MIDKIYTIYKATNIVNGKVYIGFDSNWPSRMRSHSTKSGFNKLKRKNKHDNNYFHNAINKYGKDNFEWEILYQSKDKDHTLNVMENYFICEYRSYIGFDDCNGYNRTLGGEATLGLTHTEEWRKNHSEAMSGRSFTEEHKKNISIALTGKNRSDTHRKNLSLSNKGDRNWQVKRKDVVPHPRAKKYIGISPSGEVFFIHGLNRFCANHNLSTRSVCLCVRKEREATKGWKFHEYDEELYNILKQNEVIDGN